MVAKLWKLQKAGNNLFKINTLNFFQNR